MSEFSLDDLDKVLAELQAPSQDKKKPSSNIGESKSSNDIDLDNLLADLNLDTKTTSSQPVKTETKPIQSQQSTTISVTSSSIPSTTSKSDAGKLPHEDRRIKNELDDLLNELDDLPKRTYVPSSETKQPVVTQTVTTSTQTNVNKPTTTITSTQTGGSSRTSSTSELDDILLDLPKSRSFTPNTSSTTTSSTSTSSSTITTNPTDTKSTSTLSTDGDKKICASCGNNITSTYILALDKYWCKDHFNCSKCKGSITGNFFDTPNGICCESCAKEQFQCSICKQPIKDLYLVLENGNKVHRECVPKEECFKCKKLIDIGKSYTEAVGKYWHNECFTCSKCSVSLGTTFIQFEDQPYCKTCINILSTEKNIKIQ